MQTRRRLMLGVTCAAILPCMGFSINAAWAETPLRVALIMTGPITDGAWAQLAYEGLMALDEQPGFDVGYAENVSQANLVQVVLGYADD
ncbi:unnamed protein product, partial [Ectocarpus sp. 12 AP-2014]